MGIIRNVFKWGRARCRIRFGLCPYCFKSQGATNTPVMPDCPVCMDGSVSKDLWWNRYMDGVVVIFHGDGWK